MLSDQWHGALFDQIMPQYRTLSSSNSSIMDLELVARLLFGVPGSDPNTAPLPYREATLPAKLRIGYYTSGMSHRGFEYY
jgi:hypothetical protein